VVGAVLALLALLVALFVLRRVLLARRLGAFDCSLRNVAGRGSGWSLGVAHYSTSSLDWYRIFAVSLRPARSLERSSLVVLERRAPVGPEAYAVLPDALIVRCQAAQSAVELAMSQAAYTGFASWLESAPPGRSVDVA
jgi:Protein of unknown function (DUF2550)